MLGLLDILPQFLFIYVWIFLDSSELQEFCVKKKDLVEVLTMLPLFGLLVSAVQMYPFLVGNKRCILSLQLLL